MELGSASGDLGVSMVVGWGVVSSADCRSVGSWAGMAIATDPVKTSATQKLWARGYLAGAPAQIIDQLGQLNAAGIFRVMMQWSDLDDLASLEAFAARVLPQLKKQPDTQNRKKEVQMV